MVLYLTLCSWPETHFAQKNKYLSLVIKITVIFASFWNSFQKRIVFY